MTATLLSFAMTGCATKIAQQKTTALIDTENAPRLASEEIYRPSYLPPTIDDSRISEGQEGSAVIGANAMHPIYFDYDSFLLNETSKTSLLHISKIFLKDRELKTIIAGHCDDRGSEMYNIALGEKRALSVRNYLATMGVAPDRLDVVSYGEEKPASNGIDDRSRTLNRRAEFL